MKLWAYTAAVLLAGLAGMVPAGTSAAADARTDVDRVAAYVHGEPITFAEVGADRPDADAEEVARRLREEVAGKAISRQAKLLGLDGSPEVRAELERHRQYVLIREMLETKRRDLAGEVEITDEEAAEFARRMCYTITYVKSEFGERREAEAFMEKSLRGLPTPWESEYTVVACEGAGLRMLDRLFLLEEGQMASFGRGTRFYVVKLIEMERTTSTDDLPGWDTVMEYLKRKKVDQALEDWIEGVVGRAEVRYILKPPSGEKGADAEPGR